MCGRLAREDPPARSGRITCFQRRHVFRLRKRDGGGGEGSERKDGAKGVKAGKKRERD